MELVLVFFLCFYIHSPTPPPPAPVIRITHTSYDAGTLQCSVSVPVSSLPSPCHSSHHRCTHPDESLHEFHGKKPDYVIKQLVLCKYNLKRLELSTRLYRNTVKSQQVDEVQSIQAVGGRNTVSTVSRWTKYNQYTRQMDEIQASQ
jgi:hypothetical protein